MGVLLFLLGLEAVEPLSQEIDQPGLTDGLPIARGSLHVHLLVASAGLLVPFAALGAAVVAVIEPDAAAAAFVLALPVALLGMTGAVVSTVRDAPNPIAAESPFVPPEFAGFGNAMRVLVPVAISTLGRASGVGGARAAGIGDVVRSIVGIVARRRRHRMVGDAPRSMAQSRGSVSSPERNRECRGPLRRSPPPGSRRTTAAPSRWRPLDLVVPAGQRVSLIGHNGSGKTTLIRLLTGMLEPSAGEALVAGHPAGSIEARAALAHLADQPVFYDDLSVREHLEYIARLHGSAEWQPRAEELLDATGLTDRADDLPSTFSRGLRQKAAVCLAFVRPFEVMVVDEPFVGLDRVGPRRAARAVPRSPMAVARALVIATHELATVAESERIVAFRDGAVVFDGRPARPTSTSSSMIAPAPERDPTELLTASRVAVPSMAFNSR